MVRKSVLVIMLVIAITVIGLLVIQQQSVTAGPPTPPAGVAKAESIESAKAKVPFRVRTLKSPPAAGLKPVAYVQHLPNNVTHVDVDYVTGPGSYITIMTIDHPVTQTADNIPLTKLVLPNGQSATLLDNGKAQILTWSEGNMSYQIVAVRASGPYTAAELVNIVNNLDESSTRLCDEKKSRPVFVTENGFWFLARCI